MPEGARRFKKPGKPLAAGGNCFTCPVVQVVPNVEEDRLAEILGALHRRDAQDQRRQFARGGRRDRLQFQAGDLGRMAEGRQVAGGEVPPVGKRRRQRALEPLGRQQEEPLPLAGREGLCQPAQLPSPSPLPASLSSGAT